MELLSKFRSSATKSFEAGKRWRPSLVGPSTDRATSESGASTSGRASQSDILRCSAALGRHATVEDESPCERLASRRQRAVRCLCSRQVTYQRDESTGRRHDRASSAESSSSLHGGVNGHHAPPAAPEVPDPNVLTHDPHELPTATLVERLLTPIKQHHHTDSLMAQLEEAQNVNNLRKLVHVARGSFKPQHFRAALSRLVALGEAEALATVMDKQHAQMILELVTEGLLLWADRLTPLQLVGTICLLAKMRYFNGPLLTKLMQAAKRDIPSFRPWQAAGFLWAMGRYHKDFRLHVDPQLSDLLLLHLSETLGFAASSPTHLVRALHGCALLGHPPSQLWQQGFLDHMLARMEELTPADLSNMLWSLAKMHIDPGRPWLENTLQRVETQTRGFSTGTMLASVLWSVAVLQHAPTGTWMEHFLWQVQRLLNRCDAQNLSVIAWSLASLRYRPHRVWLERFLGTTSARFEGKRGRVMSGGRFLLSQGGASPQCIANLLWALATLQMRPRGLIMKRICASMQPMLLRSTPRDLAHVLWALQRLRFLPEPDWMMEAHLAMEAKLGQFDMPCLVMALSAYGGFRHGDLITSVKATNGRSVLTQVDSRMVSLIVKRLELLFFSAGVLSRQTCTTLLVALAKLKTPISRELHVALLHSASTHLEGAPMRQIAIVCWSVCKLAQCNGDAMQLRPSSELQLLPRIQRLTAPFLQAHACNSADLLQILVAFAMVSYAPDDSWLELHEACAVRLVRQGLLTPGAVSGLLGAYKGLRCYHPTTLLGVLRSMMAGLKEQLTKAEDEQELLAEERWQLRRKMQQKEDEQLRAEEQSWQSGMSSLGEILAEHPVT